MATLRLDGDASGAVKATSDVAAAAQGLKGHFDQAAGSAKELTGHLEGGGGAADLFGHGLEHLAGHLTAIFGAGAIIGGSIEGMREFNERLKEAGDLSKDLNFGPLSQLGPAPLATARNLVGVGAGESAAGIAQAMEGAPAADVEFMRAAASTKVFGSIPSMELAARAYEAQFGGNLPTLVGQSGAAFGGTGLNAEQGLAQIQTLAPGFEGAGIGGTAGLALAGTMAHLYAGEGTGKLQRVLQGGASSGFFDDVPDSVKQDPGKLLDYIKAQGTDDATLGDEFGKRGLLSVKALLNARDDVERRYSAAQGAGPDQAYGMLRTAGADPGLAADERERAQEGSHKVASEGRGVLRKEYLTAERQQAIDETEGMVPAVGGALYYIHMGAAYLKTMTNSDDDLRMMMHNMEANTAATARNTRNAPGPSGPQE